MPVANEGIAPPDYTTPVGRVRLLTSDTDPTGDIVFGKAGYIWSSDAEIEALIDLTGSVERAALRILRLVAMTPAMQYKKWSSADLTVDGPAITRALRELINDIEKELGGAEGQAGSEFFAIVNVGAAIGQPADYPGAYGVEWDPTLPTRLI